MVRTRLFLHPTFDCSFDKVCRDDCYLLKDKSREEKKFRLPDEYWINQSLDEFMIAFFLTGTEPTLPVYIWAQFRFPVKLPSVMALGTILLVFSLALLSLSEYFRRKIAKSEALEIT